MSRPKTHEQSERLLADAVADWTERAGDLVARKLADAAAHAERASTKRLRALPDGRPTLDALQASPSFAAADRRIDELLDALVGPRADSLDGLLRDARASFYRDAFDWIDPFLVEGVHRDDLGATIAGERIARGAIVLGYDLRREFAGPVESARTALVVWGNLAATPTTLRESAADLLAAWEAKQVRNLTTRCRLSLDSSARALLWAVERTLAESV